MRVRATPLQARAAVYSGVQVRKGVDHARGRERSGLRGVRRRPRDVCQGASGVATAAKQSQQPQSQVMQRKGTMIVIQQKQPAHKGCIEKLLGCLV